MMLKAIFCGLTPLCFLAPAFAVEMNRTSPDYFFSMSGGLSWMNPDSTQTIALQPDVIDTYVPQALSNTNFLLNGEIFLGRQYHFFQQIQSQFGIAFYLVT